MSDHEATSLVDPTALKQYLENTVSERTGETFHIDRHQEGHSNETFFITWGDRDLVLRRPPHGETADSAHEVLREYRIMSCLQETDVPVPNTVAACDDPSVIGAEFYLMDQLKGDVIHEEEVPRFQKPKHRKAKADELIRTLGDIHMLDYEAAGLGDLGHPDGFTQRQVTRWTDQLEWAFERTEKVREIPALKTVGSWLEDNIPNQPNPSLVHGDYQIDNVMFAEGTPPEITAVFDWEMSTVGDPLTDLGYFLAYWADPDDQSEYSDLMPTFTLNDGYPTRREMAAMYEEYTGIEFTNEQFYRALGMYKVAGACEMFYARYLTEGGDNPLYPQMEEMVPIIADRALRMTNGEEPL